MKKSTIFIFSLFITCLSHATWTDLHQAVKNGNLEQVQNLLDAGANVNAVALVFDDRARTYNCETPLSLAKKSNHTEIATLLRRWLKYQNLLEERKGQILTFLMAIHPRIGADSPAKVLNPDLFKRIWEFVKPTIEEIDQQEVQLNRPLHNFLAFFIRGTRWNLQEADLSGANLRRADLSGPNLLEANVF